MVREPGRTAWDFWVNPSQLMIPDRISRGGLGSRARILLKLYSGNAAPFVAIVAADSW